MNNLAFFLNSAFLMGLGATLAFDLWGLFLKRAFKIAPSNFCLVGRWVLSMPEGIFRHSHIGFTPQKSSECTVGWVAHYIIGIVFACIFLAFAGMEWLQHPTMIPAILFGIITVSAPFFIMQPAFGLGIAASKTPNLAQARFRSLMNHAIFGLGLYLFGVLASWLLQ